MKAIRSIRLESVTLTRVEGPDAVLLQTDLTRDPPPMAGDPDWPNFMLLVRDASGSWRVAETADRPVRAGRRVGRREVSRQAPGRSARALAAYRRRCSVNRSESTR